MALGALVLVLAIGHCLVSSGDEVTPPEPDRLYGTDHAAVLAACREVFANQAL